jgi:hypothetical protein
LSTPAWIGIASIAGATGQLITQVLKLLWLSRSDVVELRASSLLLSGPLKNLFLMRLGVLIGAGLVLPLPAASSPAWMAFTFAAALAGEWLGRYLFFVSVVPKNMAAGFSSAGTAAA